MIKVCQMPPAKLKQEIRNQLETAKIREAPVISHQTHPPTAQMQPQAFQQPYPQMSAFRQTVPVSVPASIPAQPTTAFVANG